MYDSRLFVTRLIVLGALVLTACATPPPAKPAPPALAKELVFYDWEDDMPQAVLDEFGAEYGIKIVYKTYTASEETVENIINGEVYDVAVIESRLIPLLVAEKRLAEIDSRNVPNRKNVSANFRDLAYDPENKPNVPFNWGTTGLIVPMGEWVLQTACAQLADWRASGFPNLQVAVNFPARQFQDPNLADLVTTVLNETQLPDNALQVEITESTAMRDIEQTVRTLGKLDQLGVQISIDDFGNSYSALGYLKQFPFRILKIDQSFLRDIVQDVNNAAITTAIIAMGRTLKMRVIAEGVETPNQLEFLRSRQCDEMQGFLFSSPVTGNAMSQLLQNKITLNAYQRANDQIRKNGNGHH